ncbi:MAG: PAS domain-containing sensor histidine kinase [Actinomycetota bacterium]
MIHHLLGEFAEPVLNSVFAMSPEGLIAVDDDGTIVAASSGALKQFGYTADELLGQPIEQLVPPGHAKAHVAERDEYQVAPTPRPMRGYGALNGLHSDGSEFPVEISLTPVTIGGRVLSVALVRDVSDRITADRATEAAELELEITTERERIARDLHDTIIQSLFATGMSMQAVMGRIDDDVARERLSNSIDALDDCIRKIRTVIFGLTAHSAWGRGLRGEVLKVAAEGSQVLGFEPSVVFTGPVDSLGDEHATHIVATVREAMSNIGRHAEATSASVTVEAGDELVVTVTDNGVGMPLGRGQQSGLANLEHRARELGGHLGITSEPGKGTELELRVPLS